MISQLGHTKENIARSIRDVFQASYAVEAELLKAVDFPPLKRPLEDFINSSNTFFGFWIGNELVAVAEIKYEQNFFHIQSLVVHPNFFRRGVASKIMTFVIEQYGSKMLMVETGLDNAPAIALYKRFGFVEVKQWMTDIGIMKVRFERPRKGSIR